MQPPMKSKIETRASFGNSETIEWVDVFDRVGPLGGRAVLKGMWAVCKLTGDTTVAPILGEDLARAFGRITITQHDGVQRWNLTGDESRVASYFLNGPERYVEPADAAVANDVTHNVCIYIPFRKPHAHTPEDTCLPVDWLQSIRIQTPTIAELSVGGTFALDSASYYFLGDYQEDHDVQLYNVDRVYSSVFGNTDEHILPVNGKLHDLVIHKRGTEGGTVLTNFSSIRIDELAIPPLERSPDLAIEYKRKRSVLNAQDPFLTDRAAAVLLHDAETSIFAGKVLRTAKLGCNNTEANLRAICRVVDKASESIRNQTNAAYGLTPASYGVATDAKTKGAITDWPVSMRPFLRLKADLPKAA